MNVLPRQPDERRKRLQHARLYLVAGSETGGPDWLVAAERALASGAIGALQVREKALDDPAFLAVARRARALCDKFGALLIVNDRVSLAALCDADGAHVGADDLPPDIARLLLGPERLLGLSTHAPEEVEAARTKPVDYVGLGPCFATGSKTLARAPGGPGLLVLSLPAAGDLALFAIGGITLANAAALVAAGARRLAVGSAILRAADPAAAARRLRDLLPPAP